MFHELTDLYAPLIGGFTGIGYWTYLRRFVNHDPAHPWCGRAFPTRRQLCKEGGVGTAKLLQLRDQCVAWGLLDIAMVRRRSFAGGRMVGETRRLVYRVNDPLSADEFAAARAAGLLPRSAVPLRVEEGGQHRLNQPAGAVPGQAEGVDPNRSVPQPQGLEGMDPDRSVPRPQGLGGTDPDRSVPMDPGGSAPHTPLKTQKQEQEEQQHRTVRARARALRESPPAVGRGAVPPTEQLPDREAEAMPAADLDDQDPDRRHVAAEPAPAVPAQGGVALASTSAPDRDSRPEATIPALEPDFPAVCAAYRAITGQDDLPPAALRAATRRRILTAAYVAEKLDLLRTAMEAGQVRRPRGYFLAALERDWTAETAPMLSVGESDGTAASTDPAVPGEPSRQAKIHGEDLVRLGDALTALGVTASVAQRLVGEDPAEVAQQLAWLPHRKAQDPAALVVRAVHEHWPEPTGARQARLADERLREQERWAADLDQARVQSDSPEARRRGREALAEIRAMLTAGIRGPVPRALAHAGDVRRRDGRCGEGIPPPLDGP